METSKQLSLVEQFWNENEFEGKEFTKVVNNSIFFIPGNHWPERELLEWNVHTNVEQLNGFVEKYKEWAKECNTLHEGWSNFDLGDLTKVEELYRQGIEEKMLGDIHSHLNSLESKRKDLYEMHLTKLIDIENLIQCQESINQEEEWTQETLDRAKGLTEDWKKATNYNHAELQKFHDKWTQLRLTFNDLRNQFLDKRSIEQMNNLDHKMRLCEQAEALQDSEDWKSTGQKLEALFEEWKTIGRVTSHEKNEELWERFRAARHHFYNRRNAHFDKVKLEEAANYEKKLALVEEAETLLGAPWNQNRQRHEEIMEAWKSIGRIPFEHVNTLWERLQKARDQFFEARRANAEEFRKSLDENFEIKSRLTEQAEALQNSTQWRETTVAMNDLMDQWKNTGRISKDHGDELWERFIQARRNFFDRKDKDREERKQFYEERRAAQKDEFLKSILHLKEEIKDDQDKITEFSESIARLGDDNPKDVELKNHLKNLVQEIEKALPKKQEKLARLEKEAQA